MPNDRDGDEGLAHEPTTSLATGLATAEAEAEGDETKGTKAIAGRTPWQLARARLLRDKPSMVALTVVIIVLLAGILAPILDKLGILDPTGGNLSLIHAQTGGLPVGSFGGISLEHPFGIEPTTGRDVFSRVLEGITFSLLISISAALISMVIGIALGLISGYFGGKVDYFVSRIVDLTLSFPQTLMLLALSGTFITVISRVINDPNQGNGSRAIYIILVLGLFGWPVVARVLRAQVMSLRQREFVEAAQSLGAKPRRVLWRELLPNLWAPILIYITLLLPANVSAEAALSYLGVGIVPPTPTLGNVLSASVLYINSDTTFFLIGALSVAIVVMSFNLVGDGLRDALDPKADR